MQQQSDSLRAFRCFGATNVAAGQQVCSAKNSQNGATLARSIEMNMGEGES
jgi:hypothetical protein